MKVGLYFSKKKTNSEAATKMPLNLIYQRAFEGRLTRRNRRRKKYLVAR